MRESEERPHATPCGARTRAGTPCKNWSMRNGRCRMHGGKSTGPKTPEGRDRIRTARWKDGKYSQEARAMRRELHCFHREARALISRMKAYRE